MEAYARLRGRIREKYKTQENFAKALGISRGSLIGRLSGKLDFTTTEVAKSCMLLDVPLIEAPNYFFSDAVRKYEYKSKALGHEVEKTQP